MRKLPFSYHANNKENRYDQFTNLGIDLEGEINRSVILPRIYHKAAEMEALEYTKRRKQQEQQKMYRLKYDLDYLKQQVFRMNQPTFSPARYYTEQGSMESSYNYRSPKYMEQYNQDDQQQIQSRYQSKARIPRKTQQNQLDIRRNRENKVVIDRKRDQKSLEEGNIQKTESNPTMVRLEIAKNRNVRKDLQDSLILQKQVMKPAKKKVRRNRRLRKFRVCVYAVYFSLLIPAYARKLYRNRLANFIADYPFQVAQYFRKKQKETVSKFKLEEFKLWTLLSEKIDILGMVEKDNLGKCLHNGEQVKEIKKTFNYLISTYQLESSNKSVGQALTFEEQIMYPKNIEFLLPKAKIIFDQIMNGFYQQLTISDFLNDKWKTLELGLINNSFINNSHPKLPNLLVDSGIVRLHPEKQYLLVYDEETEVLMLINDIFCRVFIYKWLNRLQKLSPSKSYSEQSIFITKFILTIFYLISSEMIQQKVSQYIKKKQKFDQKARFRNNRLRTINQLIIGNKKGVKIEKGNLIANPPQYGNCLQIVNSHREFVVGIKEMLKEAGAQLYDKMRTFKKIYLTQTKDKTSQQQNIIRNDKRNKDKVATINNNTIVEYNQEKPSNGKINEDLYSN